MRHQITQKEFQLFAQEASRWIDTFGLKDWEVSIECHDEFPDNRASCLVSGVEDRVCRIILTRTWCVKPRPNEIALAAFHEVMELLLMPLRFAVVNVPGVDERLVDTEIHRIIRIFENTVWKQSYPRKGGRNTGGPR